MVSVELEVPYALAVQLDQWQPDARCFEGAVDLAEEVVLNVVVRVSRAHQYFGTSIALQEEALPDGFHKLVHVECDSVLFGLRRHACCWIVPVIRATDRANCCSNNGALPHEQHFD